MDKDLDFAGELKRLWNMRVTVIPIIAGIIGTVVKVIEKIDGRN